MAFKEFPKWMHHAEQGSRIFNDKEEVDQAGPGWSDSAADAKGEDQAKADQANDAARAQGLSPEQRAAAAELDAAASRKQLADAQMPPGTATPATQRNDAVEDHTLGHRGVEFATASGAREIVADVDTMDRDNLQRTLRHMGVEFDETSTTQVLRNKLKKNVNDPSVSRFAQSNPPKADPAV